MPKVLIELQANTQDAVNQIQRFAKAQKDAFDAVRAGNPALADSRVKVSQLTDAQTGAIRATTQWTTALGQLPGPLGEVTQLTSTWIGLLKGPAGLAVGLTAVAAAGLGLVKSLSDDIERLTNLSRQTGLAVSSLQAFEHAARQSGEAPDTLIQGLGRVNQALNDVLLGAPNAGKAFQAVGVDLRSLVKDGASTEQILEATARALAAIPDPTVRAAAQMELFGTRGRAMSTVLDTIAQKSLPGYVDELRAAGIVTTEETNRMAGEFDTFFDKVEARGKAFVVQFSADVARGISRIIETLRLTADILKDPVQAGRVVQGQQAHEIVRPGVAAVFAGPTKRTLAPSQEEVAAEKELAAIRQKSIEENAKAEGDRAQEVLDGDEQILEAEQKLRDLRIQSAEATRQLDFAQDWKAMEEAIKKGSTALEKHVVDLDDTKAALQSNLEVTQGWVDTGDALTPVLQNVSRELKGLPESVMGFRTVADETFIRTREKIDEGVDAFFRMRDALGPPILSRLEQFGQGFQKVSTQLLEGFASWESQGAMTAQNLFTAFDEGLFQLMHDEFDDLDDVWKAFLDAIERQIIAFLASEAVKDLLNLGRQLADSLSSGGSSGDGGGGGGGGFDILDPSTWFQRPQGGGQVRLSQTPQGGSGNVVVTGNGNTIVLGEARNAGGRVGRNVGGVVGGFVGGGLGGSFGGPIGGLAGGLVGRDLLGRFGEMIGDLIGDLLGLSSKAKDLQVATVGWTSQTDRLASSTDDAAIAAGQVAAAAANFSGDLSVLDSSFTDLTATVGATTETVGATTEGLDAFSDGVEGLGAAIGAAVEAANAAAEAAATSAADASASADRAGADAGRGFGGRGTPGGAPDVTPDSPSTGGGGGGVGAGPSPDPGQGGSDRLHGGWIGLPGYDAGGWVTDGVWGRDSVMARLARGEFVLNAGAANHDPAFTQDYNRDPARALAGVAAAGGADGSGPAIVAALVESNRIHRREVELLERMVRTPGQPRGAVV